MWCDVMSNTLILARLFSHLSPAISAGARVSLAIPDFIFLTHDFMALHDRLKMPQIPDH